MTELNGLNRKPHIHGRCESLTFDQFITSPIINGAKFPNEGYNAMSRFESSNDTGFVRYNGTDYELAEPTGSGATIYTADGTLPENRSVSGGGSNNLRFINIPTLTMDADQIELFGDTILSTPVVNNTNTGLLTVNSVSGRVEQRDVSTLPVPAPVNIYNTSGTVEDNRRIDGDSYNRDINFTQFNLFSVDSKKIALEQPLNDSPSNTIFVTQSTGGILESRKEETINGVNIYSQDGSLTGDRKLSGDGYNLTVSSIGNLGVEANTIELFNTPSVNNSNTQLLTRSAAGLVELRDVSSLPTSGSAVSRYANLAQFRLTTAIGGYQTMFNNNLSTIQTPNRLFVPGPSTRKYMVTYQLLYNYFDDSNGPIIGPTLTNLSTNTILFRGSVPRNNYLSIIPYSLTFSVVIDGNTQFSLDTLGDLNIVPQGSNSTNANTVIIERIE